MRKFWNIICAIFANAWNNIVYFVENNLRNFAWVLDFLLPYLMYVMGQQVFEQRGHFSIGSEVTIPILVFAITSFIRAYANRIGKGQTLPTPNERFTEVDEDGEVSIRNDRLQELILYIADLEDWLERKGLL